MNNNKDKPYMVYAFLIIFGLEILLLCGVLREAGADIESGYATQNADDVCSYQMTEVVSGTTE